MDRTKKVIGILNKLLKIDEDCGDSTYLEVFNENGRKMENLDYDELMHWSDGWCEQIYFITMNEGNEYINWICYVDKDDGYRSHAGYFRFRSKDIKLTWNLEKYDLKCTYKENFKTQEKSKHWDDEMDQFHNHLEVTCNRKKVFRCYTDESDSYYPIGLLEDKVVELGLK
jgi:hypothetical protein